MVNAQSSVLDDDGKKKSTVSQDQLDKDIKRIHDTIPTLAKWNSEPISLRGRPTSSRWNMFVIIGSIVHGLTTTCLLMNDLIPATLTPIRSGKSTEYQADAICTGSTSIEYLTRTQTRNPRCVRAIMRTSTDVKNCLLNLT